MFIYNFRKGENKAKRTQEGGFQSDFIYQYIEIFKSNPLQKMKKVKPVWS